MQKKINRHPLFGRHRAQSREMTLSPGSTGSSVSVYLGRMPLPVIPSPTPSVGALKKKKSIHPSHSFPPSHSFIHTLTSASSRAPFHALYCPLSLSPTRLHSKFKTYSKHTALSEQFHLYDRDSIAPSFSQPHPSVTQFTVGLL